MVRLMQTEVSRATSPTFLVLLVLAEERLDPGEIRHDGQLDLLDPSDYLLGTHFSKTPGLLGFLCASSSWWTTGASATGAAAVAAPSVVAATGTASASGIEGVVAACSVAMGAFSLAVCHWVSEEAPRRDDAGEYVRVSSVAAACS
jgi:hypothetical protein